MKRVGSLRVKRAGGFTLIELLIVIAIVLILIAIALPNFLEAQVRARVAKAKGEIRTYATALESYRIDNGGYPRDHDSAWPNPVAGDQDGYTQLTSPIKYLTELPRDPFGESVDTGGTIGGGAYRNRALYYEGGSGSDDLTRCGSLAGNRYMIYQSQARRKWAAATCIHAYMTFSIGPDHNDTTGGNDDFPYGTTFGIYNPTNGTNSNGDIYKTVGEWRRGQVFRETGSGVVRYQGEGE
ncbi:MAG: prepilin-type N-terminal cleavage/methylation domain-containing protein [Candidatus Omnitrophica bacterium]|nr:hypothetical protein [bacterium]NUN94826.1 prepilin-type N-terminal cleavage/methylation domain-containing protein [Candidatus Omnitrophota bacterium]